MHAEIMIDIVNGSITVLLAELELSIDHVVQWTFVHLFSDL